MAHLPSSPTFWLGVAACFLLAELLITGLLVRLCSLPADETAERQRKDAG